MTSNNLNTAVCSMKKTISISVIVSAMIFLLSACSSTPTEEQSAKPSSTTESSGSSAKGTLEKKFKLDNQTDSKNKSAKETEKAPVVATVDNTAILPPGPATPNPYLATKPKISDQVEVSFRDALVDMQQKNWTSAETKLQKIAATNPNLSGVFLNLGLIDKATNQLPKAEDNFNRAINANPKNVDAINQLAVLKREKGEFAEAEALYQQALTVWPFYADGHRNLGILCDLYLGQPEKALPHFVAYQQLLPQPDKQADSWVAELQRRLNNGKAPAKNPEPAPAKNVEQAPAKETEKTEAK